MKQPTILITGGTGFAGSHLIDQLIENGRTKIHATAYGHNSKYVHQILPTEQIHHLDLTNQLKTNELIKHLQPDQIYHLASISTVGSSFKQVEKIISINFQIQLSLLQATATLVPDCKILAISSAAIYKPKDKPLAESDVIGPVSPYGVSKVVQDALADYFQARHNLKIIKVRPFNHIGERQAQGFVVPDFARQIALIEQGKQQKIKVGDLSAVRDFTDVKDMVKAYILLMNSGKIGEVYNVGSGQGCQIEAVLQELITHAQTKIVVEPDPERQRPSDVKSLVCDNRKIKQLGWEPEIDIKQTLQRVLSYQRQQVAKNLQTDN